MEWMKEDYVLINGKDYIMYEELNSTVVMGKFIETDEGYSEDELHFTGPGLYRYSTYEKKYKKCFMASFFEYRLVGVDYLIDNFAFTNDCNALIHDQEYLIELPDKSLQLGWYLTNDDGGGFNVIFEGDGFYVRSDFNNKYVLVKHAIDKWIHIPLKRNRPKFKPVESLLEKYPYALIGEQYLYSYAEQGAKKVWAIHLLDDPGEYYDVNYIYTVPGFYDFNDDGVLVYMDKQPTHVQY